MSIKNKKYKPDWAKENSDTAFSTMVVSGIHSDKLNPKKFDFEKNNFSHNKKLSTEVIIQGIIAGDRSTLSRAITLVESNSLKHFDKAQEVLKGVTANSGKSIRIAVTGPPGVGKSTFIESLGSYLCEIGKNVAVLAIDPSSTRTKGSILGDKTRMEKLSRYPNSFIRPSASGGTLGGVARKTRESIILCEAAGFDVIFIETIGVGQSEISVRSMVDYFLLMILPGSGDELQGIKKGVVELADILVVNKADANNQIQAQLTQRTFNQAVHYLMPFTDGWETKVLTCSALNDIGLQDIWNNISDFTSFTKTSGLFSKRRNEQLIEWAYQMIEDELKNNFYSNPKIDKKLKELKKMVLSGEVTPSHNVQELMNYYFQKHK